MENVASLADDDPWRQTFRLIKKLPYAFSYRFEDATGRSSELQVAVSPSRANPWVIVGVFPIPHDPQQRLFD